MLGCARRFALVRCAAAWLAGGDWWKQVLNRGGVWGKVGRDGEADSTHAGAASGGAACFMVGKFHSVSFVVIAKQFEHVLGKRFLTKAIRVTWITCAGH